MLQTDEILRLNNIYKRLLANAAVKLYEGEGRIVGPNEVEVRQIDGTKISYTAKHILIATGSRAQKPNIPGHVSVSVNTPAGIMDSPLCFSYIKWSLSGAGYYI